MHGAFINSGFGKLSIASGALHTIVQVFQKVFNDNKSTMDCHTCFAMNIMSDEYAVSEEIVKRRTRFLYMMNK